LILWFHSYEWLLFVNWKKKYKNLIENNNFRLNWKETNTKTSIWWIYFNASESMLVSHFLLLDDVTYQLINSLLDWNLFHFMFYIVYLHSLLNFDLRVIIFTIVFNFSDDIGRWNMSDQNIFPSSLLASLFSFYLEKWRTIFVFLNLI
jgi:hypothetical protein